MTKYCEFCMWYCSCHGMNKHVCMVFDLSGGYSGCETWSCSLHTQYLFRTCSLLEAQAKFKFKLSLLFQSIMMTPLVENSFKFKLLDWRLSVFQNWKYSFRIRKAFGDPEAVLTLDQYDLWRNGHKVFLRYVFGRFRWVVRQFMQDGRTHKLKSFNKPLPKTKHWQCQIDVVDRFWMWGNKYLQVNALHRLHESRNAANILSTFMQVFRLVFI